MKWLDMVAPGDLLTLCTKKTVLAQHLRCKFDVVTPTCQASSKPTTVFMCTVWSGQQDIPQRHCSAVEVQARYKDERLFDWRAAESLDTEYL